MHASAQVPDNLSALVSLRTLLLGMKVVKAVPEPILALTGLEQLSITFCRLARAPVQLAGMHCLRELSLKGNSGLIVRLPAPLAPQPGTPDGMRGMFPQRWLCAFAVLQKCSAVLCMRPKQYGLRSLRPRRLWLALRSRKAAEDRSSLL